MCRDFKKHWNSIVSHEAMRLNILHIALLTSISCLLQLADTADCQHTVVDESIDCFGFAHDHGKLSLQGVQLVDKDNEPIQLRGISAHGVQWFPDCVTLSAITHLVTTWGINVFRIPVYLENSENGYLTSPAYFDSFVENLVEWCRDLGIYAIIDFHVLSKGDPNEYLDSKGGSTGVAIDFWNKYADLYKNEKHVLYEIANEPNNIDWPSVLAYHNAVISAIRLLDPDTVIIAGTTSWSQDIHLAAAEPVSQPHNVMYTFHFYAATHGFLYNRVATYIHTIPIFVSEWGISAADGNGGYNPAVAQNFLDLFADLNSPILSWTMWSWSDKDETSAILQSPSSCSSGTWSTIRCPSRYVENYFKSEDYSLMLACNSSGYVPSSSKREETSFVTKFQWIFWCLGALSLLGCLSVWNRSKRNGGNLKPSFRPVARASCDTDSELKYESNPYTVNIVNTTTNTSTTRQLSPTRSKTPPRPHGTAAQVQMQMQSSRSPPTYGTSTVTSGIPSRPTELVRTVRPTAAETQTQTGKNGPRTNSPSRQGQRRQKPPASTASSRRGEQARTRVQVRNNKNR